MCLDATFIEIQSDQLNCLLNQGDVMCPSS